MKNLLYLILALIVILIVMSHQISLGDRMMEGYKKISKNIEVKYKLMNN